MKTRVTVYFNAPGQVQVREEARPAPGPGQLLVESVISAVSPGSEMLVYRGQFPKNLVDAHDAVSTDLQYPLCYGYACVGRVLQAGAQLDPSWRDRLVFSFQPHTSHFVAAPEAVFPVPDGCLPEAAAFLPNMETAVNLVQDGAPILGERVLVLGQGIIGLLTCALLRRFPLETLVSADCYALRRQAATTLGIDACLDPGQEGFPAAVRALLGPGADLAYELSGNPLALNDAIAQTRFSGRVVIGSWYGEKQTPLDLGASFHRSRIRLLSSQVSSIAPELSGRWDKARRFETAWQGIERICPQQWITQRFPLGQAAEAYRLLDQAPDETIQVVFTYQ